jgi:hypothetical protein
MYVVVVVLCSLEFTFVPCTPEVQAVIVMPYYVHSRQVITVDTAIRGFVWPRVNLAVKYV